ncbi:MAG: hypothetical protein QGI68_15975 [Pseudomonadales bacterium]|nr:hypothetical protein [Pseudomonadales bacterium]
MLDKVSNNIVMDYPWVTNFSNPQTQEQYAYTSGMMIERLRNFFNDDERSELVNWGAGPRKEALDLSKIKVKDDAGVFGIFVAIEPSDLDLYRALLPVNFAMPERPILSLVNLDYNQPNPIVRYKEGMVMLSAVGADGKQTWYVHSMPVETWLMLAMGHDWGFRKDLFDMMVSRDKTTVLKKNGDLYMSLELTEDSWIDDSAAIIPSGQTGGITNMSVVYPRNPKLVLRFSSDGQRRALDEDKKMVKITVNRDVDWAGLVPQGSVAPGLYQRFITGGGDSRIQKLK